ncbi:MAG: glycosyltransferase [Elusimicrobiota bacterium]
MKLSIIIILNKRYEYIANCLASIYLALKHIEDRAEVELVLVIDSLNDDIEKKVAELRSMISVKVSIADEECKSMLRNYAVSEASGEILYFIDDDATVKEDFIEKVLQKFKQYPDVQIIGGPNLTPADSSLFERAQGYVLSSFWGAAGMKKRYNVSAGDYRADQQSLILCNLGMRRSALDSDNELFDMRLYCNEENHLLKKLGKRDCRMVFSPEIIVYHFRRKKLWQYCCQVFNSGRGRAISMRLDTMNFGFVFLLPGFFALYIILFPVINAIWPVALFPVIVYGLLCMLYALDILIKREKNLAVMIICFMLFPFSHFCYGLGLISGFLMYLKGKR